MKGALAAASTSVVDGDLGPMFNGFVDNLSVSSEKRRSPATVKRGLSVATTDNRTEGGSVYTAHGDEDLFSPLTSPNGVTLKTADENNEILPIKERR